MTDIKFNSRLEQMEQILNERIAKIAKIEKIRKLMYDYPNSLDININLPSGLTEYTLNLYLNKEFGFTIDLDYESNEFENIYYNQDLRSLMGYVSDPFNDNDEILQVHLLLKAYVGGFESHWLNLIEKSNVLEMIAHPDHGIHERL